MCRYDFKVKYMYYLESTCSKPFFSLSLETVDTEKIILMPESGAPGPSRGSVLRHVPCSGQSCRKGEIGETWICMSIAWHMAEKTHSNPGWPLVGN